VCKRATHSETYLSRMYFEALRFGRNVTLVQLLETHNIVTISKNNDNQRIHVNNIYIWKSQQPVQICI